MLRLSQSIDLKGLNPFQDTGGRGRTGTPEEHDFESCASAYSATPAWLLEAATGIEPVVKVLQTSALPLGYAANVLERKTGFEPATPTLARLYSTTELLPHMAGLEGIEPSHDGIKIRCLTAWL